MKKERCIRRIFALVLSVIMICAVMVSSVYASDDNTNSEILPRGAVCCSPSTMNKVTAVQEVHYPQDDLLHTCVVNVYEIVKCSYCGARFSETFVRDYVHYHW